MMDLRLIVKIKDSHKAYLLRFRLQRSLIQDTSCVN